MVMCRTSGAPVLLLEHAAVAGVWKLDMGGSEGVEAMVWQPSV